MVRVTVIGKRVDIIVQGIPAAAADRIGKSEPLVRYRLRTTTLAVHQKATRTLPSQYPLARF